MTPIHFLSPATFTEQAGRISSEQAAGRYRTVIPALQLARHGHGIQLGTIPWNATKPPDTGSITAKVVVFSNAMSEANLVLARALATSGKRIIVDQCDNQFEHEQLGDKFREQAIAMCRLASTVITSTPAMAELIQKYADVYSIVISDPVEGTRRDARFEPKFPRVKLLWFGNPVNWKPVADCLPSLAELARTLPLEMQVLTRPTPQISAAVAAANVAHGERLKLTLQPWTHDSLWPALDACDIVIIPSGQSEFFAAKSPNRVAESVWAGRMVVAHSRPSYVPFADAAWLGEDIAAGVKHAIDNPGEIRERVRRGQEYVEKNHSPWVIGDQWAKALGLAPEKRVLKLNLGCGDKILPDYVNVDVVESRAGQKPDVLCDLHRLTPFADNSAEEILSVHVVEHFWRWEVRDILREWVRVLKPGGKMILECPNLQSACEHFLKNPEIHSREDRNGQRSMWVFYGDPAWKDPYMIHRWGYTPASLATLMAEAGLVDVKQEPAQHKLREPRDMRVTGTKPT